MDSGIIQYTYLLLLMIASSGYGFIRIKETSIRRAPVATENESLAPSLCTESVPEKVVYCNNKFLEFVPNYLNIDIQVLDIAENDITKLSNTSFDRYPLLHHLDVSFNLISVIETETFKPLLLLTFLNLESNPYIQKINDEMFAWSTMLQELNLTNIGLTHFPHNTMKWLPNLKTLTLGRNELNSIHFDTCPSEEANTSVDLSFNNISAFTSETISIDCHFSNVYFHENPVKRVDPKSLSTLQVEFLSLGGYDMTLDSWSQAFRGISQSEISSLAIYPTGITHIPRNFFDSFRNHSPSFLHIYDEGFKPGGVHPLAFRNLTGVKGLFISDTNLTKIRPDTFYGMRQLETLYITWSIITSIKPSKIPWDNIRLYDINLSHNSLTEIRPYAFRGLTALQTLDLSYNGQLAFVNITSFTGLINLRILDLRETRIIQMSLDIPLLEIFSLANSRLRIWALSPGRTFRYTMSLRKISLAYARVYTAYLYDNEKNISLFQGLRNLSSLVLRGNLLRSLDTNMFANLLSLEILDLGQSEITIIPLGAFNGLESLQVLYLDSNQISLVICNMFRDLTQLGILDMANNAIEYLENNFFRHNSFLSSLDISNNHFASFNQSTFKDVSANLKEIDISGNPIVCDCELKWLSEWLYNGPIQIMFDLHTICSPVSATLIPLRGKPLAMLASTNLCYPQISTYVSVAFLCLTVTVIILATYWHRWFLKHKLFLLKLAIVGYKEMEDRRNPDEFEYNLNIMFTNDCEEWMQQHFRPFLEEALPERGRVVFGDDDLKLGKHYLDAVLYAVENSFKTVLLLSRAAVRDHWFMLKFRLAMDYATDIGTEKLILIFIEDILDDDLPYLVRLFLSGSGSYLGWVEEEAGQEYFWKELEKYLNVNRRMNYFVPVQ